MGIAYNTSIVRDGLILHLDAANIKSYPGTGTLWSDISGNNNNGTLTGGPTYDPSNNGSIVLDGTDDYSTLPTNLLIPDSGDPFTFSLSFKTSSTGIILGQQSSATPGTASSFVPAIYVGTDGLLYTSCFWGGSTSNRSVSSVTVNDGNWHNITVTFSSSSQISYLDGVAYTTLAKTQASYSATYYYFLGTGRGVNWTNTSASPYFNGNIASALCYNRALSDQEIKKNFEALRGRYGL
jgi:hypothetical protein